jgi:hypothetical protein
VPHHMIEELDSLWAGHLIGYFPWFKCHHWNHRKRSILSLQLRAGSFVCVYVFVLVNHTLGEELNWFYFFDCFRTIIWRSSSADMLTGQHKECECRLPRFLTTVTFTTVNTARARGGDTESGAQRQSVLYSCPSPHGELINLVSLLSLEPDK